MTPAARAQQLARLRATLAAWDPTLYSSRRIARAARTRTLHALRRLEREAAAVAAGLPAGAWWAGPRSGRVMDRR